MAETTTYKGSCHCGEVSYEVDLELGKVIACNCSICSRMGWLLSFVPASQFRLLSGEKVLVDYQFGKKSIHHPFCSKCGIRSFCGGTDPGGNEVRGVNVRCLEGVEVDKLEVMHYDGKNF